MKNSIHETYANFLLTEVYRTARYIEVYNYDGSITPDTTIKFGWGYQRGAINNQKYYYIYQNGTIYLMSPETRVNEGIHVTHFTPEQDHLFRNTAQNLIDNQQIIDKHKYKYLDIKEITPKELATNKYQVIPYFCQSLQHYQEQQSLQSPVYCDGCEQHCYIGYQKYPDILNDLKTYEYPTINHIWANKCPEKCANNLQKHINMYQTKSTRPANKKTFTQVQRTNIPPKHEHSHIPLSGKCNGCNAQCELGTSYAFNENYVFPTIDNKIITCYIHDSFFGFRYQYPYINTYYHISPEVATDIIANKIGIITCRCDHYKTR